MTASTEEIRQKIADEQFEFSKHAVDQLTSCTNT